MGAAVALDASKYRDGVSSITDQSHAEEHIALARHRRKALEASGGEGAETNSIDSTVPLKQSIKDDISDELDHDLGEFAMQREERMKGLQDESIAVGNLATDEKRMGEVRAKLRNNQAKQDAFSHRSTSSLLISSSWRPKLATSQELGAFAAPLAWSS